MSNENNRLELDDAILEMVSGGVSIGDAQRMDIETELR